MAKEYGLIPDYESVDPEELSVYSLPPDPVVGGEHPTALLLVEGVRAKWPIEGMEHEREFEVEVEYDADELAVDEESFASYLDTYSDARISQEAMTQLIREHLTEALEVPDVFVEVSNTKKNTRLGTPDHD